MRKTIGWVSFVLQLITIVFAGIIVVSTSYNDFVILGQFKIGSYIALQLLSVWAGMSLGNKLAIARKTNVQVGFFPSVFGIIALAVFLVAFNPGPSFPETTTGLIITIAFSVFFMIDLIDATYQKTCKL